VEKNWKIKLKKIVWIKPPCPDPLPDTPKYPLLNTPILATSESESSEAF
jgi:hypothetical protein